MAFIRRPGGASYPTAFTGGGLEADYTADSLLLADGAPVTLLRNNTGNGVNLAPGGGGTNPTFRIDDDFLPYIAFDGVGNNLQNLAFPGGLLLTPKTMYSVLRVETPGGTANAKAITLNRNGVVAGVADGTWTLRPDAGKRHMVQSRGIPAAPIISAGVAEPNDAFSAMQGVWIVSCQRFGNRGNPATWFQGYWQNSDGGFSVRYGGGAPFTAWNYDRLGVGSNPDIAPFANDFCKMDFRAFSLFNVCHNDVQVAQNMRFLAHKWKVGILD